MSKDNPDPPLTSPPRCPEDFKKAVERLARELSILRNEMAAFDGYQEAGAPRDRFLAVASGALPGDQLIRLVRIFEDSKKVASFWYLYRCDPRIKKKIDVRRIQEFSSKIKKVRNATFVHIDKTFLFDPQTIYRDVGIRKSEIAFAVATVWRVVSDLWIELGHHPLTDANQSDLKNRFKESLSRLVAKS